MPLKDFVASRGTTQGQQVNLLNESIRNVATCNVADLFDQPFLIVGQNNRTIRVPLNGGHIFPLYKMHAAFALDRDCAAGRFYWSTGYRIFSAKYNATDKKPFISDDIGFPRALAVDWISRRLYWTDAGKITIEVASLENPDVRTVLFSENFSLIKAIAVDPLQSKLYWSHWFDGTEKIEWSNLDGTERRVLVSSPRVKEIRNMHVLMATGELCYSDAGTRKLECVDPHNKQIRTIATNLTDPTTMVPADDLFYWTEWDKRNIESINLDGVHRKPITSSDFDFRNSFAMTAVTDKCPFFYSPCAIDNGDCPEETICLVNPSAPTGKNSIVRQKCNASVYAWECFGVIKHVSIWPGQF